MEFVDIKKIYPDEILFSVTSKDTWDMSRLILLENNNYNDESFDFVLIEGSHCSCYGFSDIKWEGMKLTTKQLVKLLKNVQPYEELRLKLKDFLCYYSPYFKEEFENGGDTNAK